jgi:hypothetical protein
MMEPMFMSSNVARLSINAAFLAEMKESNVDYQECLQGLRDLCDANCSQSRVIDDGGHLLHRLRDVFATQCELEETYGYVRIFDAKTPTPFDENVQKTFEQHREISLLLMELSEHFDDLQYQGTIAREISSVLEELRHLNARLWQHEDTELDLIRSLMSGAKKS